MRVTLSVNGERHELELAPLARLADVLRDELGLVGTKIGCGEGACGACAVLLDGRLGQRLPHLAAAAEGHELETIEGISRDGLTPLQEAFVGLRCRAVRLLHARARSCRRPRCCATTRRPTPAQVRRGDERQHLPLRLLREDRARHPQLRRRRRLMPRLVKTVTEIEGRFEEKWVLVEEDGIVSWEPDAELAVVGKPAPRQTGPQRVSGVARYTVDVALPGMLHAAVLRSPRRPRRASRRCRSTPPAPSTACAPCSAPRPS